MIDVERYLILVEGGEPPGYSAWSPDVPGCAATGRGLDECPNRMREALALHLAALAEDGDQLPEATGPGVYLERSAASAA